MLVISTLLMNSSASIVLTLLLSSIVVPVVSTLSLTSSPIIVLTPLLNSTASSFKTIAGKQC